MTDSSPLLIPILTDFETPFFLPHIFLGTASGQFLHPAASRLLLSGFRPYSIGFPPIKQPLSLGQAVEKESERGKKKQILRYAPFEAPFGFTQGRQLKVES
jgi:hypothetical protein